MRLNLAATCVTLVFIIAQVSRVSAVEKSCPAYRNCGIPWNIESTSKQRCCEGVATVHGCRNQGTTMACWVCCLLHGTCTLACARHKLRGEIVCAHSSVTAIVKTPVALIETSARRLKQ